MSIDQQHQTPQDRFQQTHIIECILRVCNTLSLSLMSNNTA